MGNVGSCFIWDIGINESLIMISLLDFLDNTARKAEHLKNNVV